MSGQIDLAGQRFGRLVALDSMPGGKGVGRIWRCRCDCGNETTVLASELKKGTQSCGCLRGDHLRTHGLSRRPEYRTWLSMRRRCHYPGQQNYKRYGGSGVTVCDRWLNDFPAFLADMGPKPTPRHSLDRWPDPAGNYEPSNCRWATMIEQRANRRAA